MDTSKLIQVPTRDALAEGVAKRMDQEAFENHQLAILSRSLKADDTSGSSGTIALGGWRVRWDLNPGLSAFFSPQER
jgi:hypothetical protein